tara:strand:- start:225 stop:1232 length:1008 start_codon:yes stop_codon:yes gene_type:complete
MMKFFQYILCFHLFLGNILAVDKIGTTAAKFLHMNVGSRAVGMGGAFTSIANDASAMYWNPAGLSFYRTKEVFFNHSNWIADISFDYFGFSLPLMNNHFFGLNITSVTMNDMEVTRYGNEDTGETFVASNFAIGATYSLNLTDRFSIGFNGKYVQEIIANNNATGIALDIGTLFSTPYGFKLGTSISNFGPKMNMTGDDLLVPVDIDETMEGNNESVTGYLATDDFDLPLILRVGISDDLNVGQIGTLTWSIDVNSPNDNSMYVNAGIECGLFNNLFVLRTGMNSLFLHDREKELSMGLGFNMTNILKKNLYINYSVETLSHLGETHQFSIQLAY